MGDRKIKMGFQNEPTRTDNPRITESWLYA